MYFHCVDCNTALGLEKIIPENSSVANWEALHVTGVLCEAINDSLYHIPNF